jgi:hypothetical protein
VFLNRNEGVWRVNAAFWGVSPGFESNDLGFHSNGDRFGGHAVLMWQNNKTTRWTRFAGAWVAKAMSWNFNHEKQSDLWFGCANAQLKNYWFLHGCSAYFGRTFDDRLTRGGPTAVSPRGGLGNVGFGTDSRKVVSFDVSGGVDRSDYGGWGRHAGVTVSLKALSSLTISTGPEWNISRGPQQYIGERTDGLATSTFGTRYVFAPIVQSQLTLTTRINYIVTPRASLHVFMQPLLAAGDYGTLTALAAPRTFDFAQYVASDGSAVFDNPDFNFKSLKVNAVFRWEFTPGSTIYAVWTQQREDTSHPGQFRFARDASALFSAPANDIFLVKMTYWIGR